MRKNIISFISSVIFTSLLLFFLFQYISIAEIIIAIKSISFKFIITGFVFHLSTYLLRTIVLNLFLKEENISFINLLSVHFIHNFYNHLIPANLGELSFPLLLKKKVTMSKSFAALFVMRLVTGGLTLLLFVISVFYIFDVINIFDIQLKKQYLFVLFLCILIFFIYKFRKIFIKVLLNIRYLDKLYNKINIYFKSIKHEIIKLKKPRFLFKILTNTFLSIMGLIFFYMTLLKGLNIHLNVFQFIFVFSIVFIVLILPIKTLGGFGTSEGSLAIGLMIIGITKNSAIKAGFALHIYTLVNVIILFCVGILIKYLVLKKSLSKKKFHNVEH